ncbi:surface antigen TASV, putative,hypothetical protein [Trypanosoma cruzi marinkellei]|uniref:Mucin-associated surface protein (MASP) n=1 Tax=Trypanosoma cruzi marinkellei TaxID=85056 RepID=K2NKP0_TRYCR|nr:surface antigen TASV, putative,hypothetical protein [Trypanosoma cruzi marinkellei]
MTMIKCRLLCALCSFSVCGGTADSGADSPASTVKNWMDGEFLCPGADGNLSWRFFGEAEWRKCPNKPEEGGGDDDGCAQVCDAVGKFYESMKDTGMCTPGSNATGGESRMLFQLDNNTKNCSSTVAAQNKDQAVADVTQQLQSHLQAGAAAGAAVVNQSQSGVGSPPGKADPAPQKNSPEHAGEGGSDPRPGENMVASSLTLTDAKEHVASAFEASGQSSSSPSGDGSAKETSHNNNASQPTTDGSRNGTATGMRDPGGADGSDATTAWVCTSLLLLVTVLLCAAVC